MNELHGWDRTKLMTAAPSDVEAARLSVYVKARRPEIEFDYEGRIAEIQRAEMQPKSREREEKRLRGVAVEKLRAGQRSQAALRELLELDAEDDD